MMIKSNVITKRVNLVLRLFDDYDLDNIMKSNILINGEKYKKIVKDGGYNVFLDVPEKESDITVESPGYIEKTVQIDVGQLNPVDPIVNIRLKPLYDIFDSDDGVIIKFHSEDIKDEEFQVYLSDSSHGEISEKIAKGEDKIPLTDFFGEVLFGDVFCIENDKQKEFIEIKSFDGQKCYLKENLENSFEPEAKIRRAFVSKCDSKGRGLIYFRKMVKKKNNIKILINNRVDEVSIDVEGYNKIINLGNI